MVPPAGPAADLPGPSPVSLIKMEARMLPARVLVVNLGSTSTRTALFRGDELLGQEQLVCPPEALANCERVIDQVPMRTAQVKQFLARLDTRVSDLDAIAARGGPLRPMPGGVYRVNAELLADARSDEFIEHVSKIACIVADELTGNLSVPAFIVDPVSTDEYDEISRISGLKDLPRKSVTHALNMRWVARTIAARMNRPYDELNLITAHLGGGISIAVHSGGRMVDSVDANGEGPFSPERSGGLRADDVARLAIDSGESFAQFRKRLTRNGGLMSHLHTTDAIEVERLARCGEQPHRRVYEAMAYGIAKHICALSAAVYGKVDGIVLTGGLARSALLVEWIVERVEHVASVTVLAGEFEMQALHEGVTGAITGREPVRIYPTREFEGMMRGKNEIVR